MVHMCVCFLDAESPSALVELQHSSGHPCKCQNAGTDEDPSLPELLKTSFSFLSVNNSQTLMMVHKRTRRPEGGNQTENRPLKASTWVIAGPV